MRHGGGQYVPACRWMNLTSQGMLTAGRTPQVLAGATDKTRIIVTQSCSELIIDGPGGVWTGTPLSFAARKA
jgi:hypothetical protein